MSLIKVENLKKIYCNDEVETKALNGVSFEISEGDFVAIMGPSGSGKSTLMQILGFLDNFTSGKYSFNNQDTETFSQNQLAELRNEKIGFIFQSFNLLPRTTVFENVEMPLLYVNNGKKISKTEKVNRIKNVLRAVGMEHRIEHFSNQLSGGEKQRVAIARALINNPDIIFADEPTGNLDSKSGLQVMEILQKLNDEGHTVILVTHETYTAEHAKRILLMKDGVIVKDSIVQKRREAINGGLLK